jgi:mannan endo-1,6-alpha-mannosidase
MNDYNDVTNIPGGVPGLFDSEKVVYSFWETGTVWNSLVEYSNLTGDTQFNQAIASGVLFQISGTNDFMPPNQTMNLTSAGQSSWALTAMAAAEAGLAMPKDQSGKWVDLAINVFNDQVAQWDIKTCGGGIRSQVFPYLNGYLYKDSWTASSFFL